VRLFVGRAERFSNRFALTPSTLRDVAELTRRLEGMPLAIELAATWVRGLTVGEILVRLRQGLGLLESSGLGVPDRQRNLQAILAYAWQMLSADEQSALARLAVFRGGFELEAAQQVAGAHLGLLLRLINQALVRRAEDGRYDLHELVRQFAAGHLAGEAHAEAMARFAAWTAPHRDRRATFVARPAAFDWPWIVWYAWTFLGDNPFGFKAVCASSWFEARGRTFKVDLPHRAVDDAEIQLRHFFEHGA
jgi:predicted ATPase